MCHRSYSRRGVEGRSREHDEAVDGVENDRSGEESARRESEESPAPAETPLARVVRAPVAALRALVA